MRTVAAARRILAERRGKYHRVHTFCEFMPPAELNCEIVIGAAAEHKLDFIPMRECIQIFDSEGSTFTRLRTLYIDNLDDRRRNVVQRPFATGFKQDRITFVEQSLHERHEFAFLEHGLSAGDFDEPARGTQARNFTQDFSRRHLVATLKSVLAVAPGAAQVTSGQAHEDARETRVGRLTL